ncbi:DMT family transporter [Campylobacter sp. RM12327]|uniref:DMT family transporter n=1 Tax=Campylobacter sputorum TaxID=206 RepID=UPI000B78968E|nr:MULTISPECIES: DMT family transporter [Campylobacter]ASM39631.1 putative membrane protein, putative permease (EamA domain), type 5 [Campylobacter sputorum]MBE7358333.1 DMT family transporter [Campylobacter sp. RM11302]MBF6669495.1 DMT family transporter [Campylobacter sp. RM12327]MBF6674762.1 DMT family transporter [Campylobacter sp. RM13538]MBF6676397.1 DMT family transporter [Campylobacter sp. RM12321]
MSIKNKTLLADTSLLIVAISWGCTFLIVQEAINSVNVSSFLFWRFFLATILMYVISFKFGIKFDKKSVICGAFLGLFLFGGFVVQTYALKYTLSSTVAFITGTNVVIVPFFMLLIFKFKVSKFTIFGAILAFFGLYFLSGANKVGIAIGEILAFICAIFYALHITFTDKFIKKCNIYGMVTMQFLIVSILCLFAAIFFSQNSYGASKILGGLEISKNGNFIFAVLLTSIVATVFAFFVQSLAQKYTTASKTALIFTFEPVSAGIFGYIFGEILSKGQIFGAFLIIIAILISEIGNTVLKNKKT